MASSLPEDTAICPEMNPIISAVLAKPVFDSPLLPDWHEHCPVFLGPGGCSVRRRHGRPGKSSAMGIAGPAVWQPGYEAAALGRGPRLGAVHLHAHQPPDLVLGCRIEAGTGGEGRTRTSCLHPVLSLPFEI